MALSLPGIGSNLDVESLVTQLMRLERRPLEQLEAQARANNAKLSAYGSLKGLLAGYQATLEGLTPEKLGPMKAALSDSTLAQASAGIAATPGSHSLEVLALAQPHRLKSSAFASTAATVGTGTLTFEFGTWDGAAFSANPAKTGASVAIAPGQSTLAGVRDAVNAAAIGVTASIVNDGTGEVLVFSSNDSGAASSLRVTVADDDANPTDSAGLSQLAYDPAASAGAGRNLAQAQAATDATFVLDGITIARATNTVSDALAGVTLTLARAAPGSPATLAVSRDTAAAQVAVESFVKGYNDARKALAALTAYDPATRVAGTLKGESVLRVIDSQMRAAIGQTSAGLGGTLTRLSQAGLSLKSDGSLTLDAAKLQAALASNADDVVRLFAATGRSADSRITVTGFTRATTAGSHEVVVTQPATRGTLAASAAAGLTITAGVNDVLTLSVDAVTTTVTLTAGTYADTAALAAELQGRLNGSTALVQAGAAIDVVSASGVLTVQSRLYGANSAVTAAAGNAAAGLFGTPVATAGVDVAGSLGGVAATGSGRTLAGAAGSAVEGLLVRVDATAAGTYSVDFARGHADRLATVLGDFLDAAGGIPSRIDGLNAAAKRIQARGEAVQRHVDATEKRLRAQFAVLDALMARMNQTSSYLAQQLASLPGAAGKD